MYQVPFTMFSGALTNARLTLDWILFIIAVLIVLSWGKIIMESALKQWSSVDLNPRDIEFI